MKKKLTLLGIIAVLTLSMSSLISAAPSDPVGPKWTCPLPHKACPEPY